MTSPAEREPMPTPGTIAILPLVIADLQQRDTAGTKKYGTTLQANNGRDALVDLSQELMDAVMYLRQYMEEMECLGIKLSKLRDVLAESQSLERDACVSLADSLTRILKENPALSAEQCSPPDQAFKSIARPANSSAPFAEKEKQ